MGEILLTEINKMKYLFNYKKGVVISEQSTGSTSTRIISNIKGDYDASNKSNEMLQSIVDEISNGINSFASGDASAPQTPYDTDRFCYTGELNTKFELENEEKCESLITSLIEFVLHNEPDLSGPPFFLVRKPVINELDELRSRTYPLSEFLEYVKKNEKTILKRHKSTQDFTEFTQYQDNVFVNGKGINVSVPDDFLNALQELNLNIFYVDDKEDGSQRIAYNITSDNKNYIEYSNEGGQYKVTKKNL